MKLAHRISLAVVALLVLAGLSSVTALLSARRLDLMTRQLVRNNVASVRAAEELEIALLEQRGVLASFILDRGRIDWLDDLQRAKESFSVWLARTRATARTPQELRIVGDLEAVFRLYNERREAVITLCLQGETERARQILLTDVSALYEQAFELCEAMIAANEETIQASGPEAERTIRAATIKVGASVAVAALFGFGLLVLLDRKVLRPLRRMTDEARLITADDGSASPAGTQDELGTLGFYLEALAADVSETRSHLERSRAQLVAAEKLATVGKLAASVAHEIRNPLSSLKMRLYAIQRAVGRSPEYEDDFRVVSDELNRLESIIRNFLEFSRPPALQRGTQAPARLVDQALALMRVWLAERQVEVVRRIPADLPPVCVDPDQIKQVFINLIRNSVDAMEGRGRITITAEARSEGRGHGPVVLRFEDDGPGIPEAARERIFEPFFSTKDDGTGLGLSIAAHIMARHGGRLDLESTGPQGTVFAVGLPPAEVETPAVKS